MASHEIVPASAFTKGTAERRKSATSFSFPGFACSGTYRANFVIACSCFDRGQGVSAAADWLQWLTSVLRTADGEFECRLLSLLGERPIGSIGAMVSVIGSWIACLMWVTTNKTRKEH